MKEKDKLESMRGSCAHPDYKKLCFELSKNIQFLKYS